MICRLFTAASVVSLLLCTAAIVLWVRSYWIADDVERIGSRTVWTFTISRGRVEFHYEPEADTAYSPLGWQRKSSASPSELKVDVPGNPLGIPGVDIYRVYVNAFGFGLWTFQETAASARIYWLIVPFWFVALVFAIPSILLARKHWRPRHSHLHCQTCGYDLRGSTDRCPECGTPITLTAG